LQQQITTIHRGYPMSTPDFLSTARKWRPQQFVEIVGQDHITTTLRNALASGRVHHAYLFCGPRGVGKTTTARIIARALNCAAPVDGIEPCNQCQSCQDILIGRSMDVVEIDGASNNSVDDIRRIRENAKYPPAFGKYRVYIIDEVHMLSTSAFNALLKTLEEPPAHLLFIFATTEPHKVPATIQSRCQRFDFHRMDTRTIASHLGMIAVAEGVSIDEDALFTIARFADGSMRDAQSLFDQVRAYATGTITGAAVRQSLHVLSDDVYFAITDAIAERNLAKAFDIAAEIIAQGFDVQQAMLGLLEHLRNALTLRATGTADLIEAADETRQRYQQLAQRFSQEDLVQMMTIVSTAEQQLRYSAQPRIRFELLLAQLVHLPSTCDIGTLVAQLEALRGGSPVPAQSAAVSGSPTQQKESTNPPPTSSPSNTKTPGTSNEVGAADKSTAPVAPARSTPLDWGTFIKGLPRTLQVAATLLQELPPPQREGNRFIIACGDRAALDALSLKKKQLERALKQAAGADAELELVLGPSSEQQPSPSPVAPAATPSSPSTEDSDDRSPIERALIERFRAQRLPST
jgi:DNA polymerase-3 subunit gamma/tau